jgi:hypothetical protein
MIFPYKYLKFDRKLDFVSDINICVVYTIWFNPVLIDMVIYSILSFYKNTDIHRCHIRIFISECIYDLIEDKFELLGLSSFIIKVPLNLNAKQTILLHNELKDFEKLCLLDSDLFSFFQHDGKYNLFEKMYYLSNERPVVFDKTLTTNEYEIRQRAFNKEVSSKSQKFVRYPKDDFWIWSPIFCIRRDLLQDLRYYQLVLDSASSKYYCDESIFMTYFDMIGISCTTVSQLPYVLAINKWNLTFYKNNIFAEECQYLKLLHIVEPVEIDLVQRILKRVFSNLEKNNNIQIDETSI